MTAETTDTVVTDDLDAFSDEFYGIAPKEEPEAPEAADVEPAPEADKPEDEVKPEADDVDPVDEPEEKPEANEKPKGKKTAQERISELTAARREAERRAEELEQKLSELQKGNQPESKPESKAKEPSPDDVGEDGEPKYALGEFDPQYIRDLTKFTLQQEKAAADAAREEEDKARQQQTVRDQLINDWNGRIEAVEEELPDFRAKAATLEDTFSDIDPRFGEYLATTIMSLDAGPQVLYYLAENLDEAESIVGMGPVMAAVALGRIEASLKSKAVVAPKTSDAPPPPPRNRGGSVRMTVPGDTDDLDAFEKEFFKKK